MHTYGRREMFIIIKNLCVIKNILNMENFIILAKLKTKNLNTTHTHILFY